MNTKNNKRRRESREKIEKVFIELLQTKEIGEITVSEIIKQTGLNRSTFYANYEDVYALADKIRDNLEIEVSALYEHEETSKYSSDAWLRLFYHIRDNQIFYNIYFKLGYDNAHKVNMGEFSKEYLIFPERFMEYHIEFFKAGFNAIVKKWLQGGCKETPEEMSEILKTEYNGRICV